MEDTCLLKNRVIFRTDEIDLNLRLVKFVCRDRALMWSKFKLNGRDWFGKTEVFLEVCNYSTF